MYEVSMSWRWERCLSVSSEIGEDRKPLFIIVDVLLVYNVFMKFIYSGETLSFCMGLKGKFLSILSKAFSWSICNT